MRGVWFSERRKKYRVKHKGEVIGFYADKDEALKVKKELNGIDFYKKYTDINGKKFGNYEVVGLTDENKISDKGSLIPTYICRNTDTGDIREIRRDSLLNGGAIGNRRGLKKAYPNKSNKSFYSKITILGESYFLGSFINKKDAEEAYDKALSDFVEKGEKPNSYRKISASDSKIIHYMMSGKLKGVNYVKNRKTWKASLYLNGKFMVNKTFNTKQEAIEARLAAEEKYFKPILEKYEKNINK